VGLLDLGNTLLDRIEQRGLAVCVKQGKPFNYGLVVVRQRLQLIGLLENAKRNTSS